MIHPLATALTAIFAANLASRIFIHPKEPLLLRTDRTLAWRLLLEAALLIALFGFSGPFRSGTGKTLACALVYLLLSIINEFVWKRVTKGSFRYLGTYLIHASLVLVTALVLSQTPIHTLWNLPFTQQERFRFLIVALVYLATIFLGGRLIRRAIRSLGLPSISDETPSQLQDAGLYIGWLERFLVITAICMQAPMIVGLILTAKSVARFPDFQKAKFAEYFLVGTLLSLALAVLAGLILTKVLYGTIRLK